MSKIIWFDDRHAFGEYNNSIDVFKTNGYEVIPVSDLNLNSFLKGIADNTILPENIACLILDMSWKGNTPREGFFAKYGIAVGMELYDKLMKSSFKKVKTIVYTITEDEDVKSFCKKYGILYLCKETYFGSIFVSRVIQEIKQ